MIPVFQTKHGLEGNCFAACVASLLEIQIESCGVDGRPENWFQISNAWLNSIGFQYLEIRRDEDRPWPAFFPLGSFCILSGDSPRVDKEHAIIGKLESPEPGELAFVKVHDPAGRNAGGIKNIRGIGFIMPLSAAAAFKKMQLCDGAR